MDTLNVISSPASAGGRSLCNSPDGPQLDLFGQALAHASLSQPLAKDSAPQTSGTSGPCSPNSSAPASLQQCLANRLRARLAGSGSPEYSLTWKEWAISGQEPICALRAVAHRTSDKGCGGWPTPNVPNGGRSGSGEMYRKDGSKRQISCEEAAKMAGWPTPGEDNANNAYGHKGTDYSDLPTTAQMASGQPPSSSPAATAKPAALNPAFSRWLQGYPVGWCQAAIKAFRKMKRTPRQKPGSQG